MTHPITRRDWIAGAAAGLTLPAWAAEPDRTARPARPQPGRTLRIYGITFRGMTEVERGFEEYFASRKIPAQIVWRDLNRDNARMQGFLDEIRGTKPDLVYTWGTSVTLGVVGPFDKPDREKNIGDIPVVFTLVAAPVQAKIVPSLKSSGRLLAKG